MIIQNSRLYHFFLCLAIINMLAYFLLFGHSTIDTSRQEKGLFSDTTLNYFVCSSLLVSIIWLTYHFLSDKLISPKLVWVHVLTVFAIISLVPWSTLKYFPMPRFWLNSMYGISALFGNMTSVFLIAASLLLASEVFLISNIKRHTSDTSEGETLKWLEKP